MNDLFRFVLMRPPNMPATDEVHVLSASFIRGAPTWERAKSLADEVEQAGKLLAAGDEVADAVLARAVVGILANGPKPAAEVIALVEAETGQTPDAIASTKGFVKAAASVTDTLVALKLLSSSLGRDAADLTILARGLDAIARTAEGVDPISLRPLALPSFKKTTRTATANKQAHNADQTHTAEPAAPEKGESTELLKRFAALEQAIQTLGRLTASDIEAAKSEVPQRPSAPSSAAQATASGAARSPAAQEPSRFGVHAERPWMLSQETVKVLPQAVRSTLRAVEADPKTDPLPAMLDSLHRARLAVGELIDPSVVTEPLEPSSEFVGPPSSSMPTEPGQLQPAGIGDLLLVREHTKAYQGGEVAHIENVLKSETMSRDTRRLERTETTLLQESETTKEEERDTQTTERFSLTHETNKTIQTDAELKAGLTVDAKYGPFVEVKANADFATKSSEQDATKQASEYSKDVVARSVAKVVERVRQQRTVTTLAEFEEKYSHGFDNVHGAANISGVYQWVDEVLEAQIYDYGKRLLFDVTIPEPATAVMLMEAANKPMPQGLAEPLPFTIDASQITETNYTIYAQRYDATGLEPPPALVKSFSKPFANIQHEDPHEATGTESIPLDDGYAAQYALFTWEGGYYSEAALNMLVGSVNVNAFSTQGYLDMAKETGSIPLSFAAYQVEFYAMNVEIFCQRTEQALDSWRLKTHATILEAYVAKEAAYRQALSEAQAEAASAAYGRSPELNAQVINSELRKQCLTLVTGQEFGAFGALETSPEGFAEPNLARTEEQMPYVRFFEQAFEWERITYSFYPYFWGWKQAWGKRMLLEDTDPAFATFLRAGAARVVFPVRPGFEEAVLHYLETGKIWNGGPPPTVNDKLYVPIVKEIQEAEGAPGEELPQGEPWPVTLPTTLVRLRPNDDLPEWKKVGEQWAPVN